MRKASFYEAQGSFHVRISKIAMFCGKAGIDNLAGPFLQSRIMFLQFDECQGKTAASIGFTQGPNQQRKKIFKAIFTFMEDAENVYPIAYCQGWSIGT